MERFNRLERKKRSSSKGRTFVLENFKWNRTFHLHLSRLNKKFWLNGKRPRKTSGTVNAEVKERKDTLSPRSHHVIASSNRFSFTQAFAPKTTRSGDLCLNHTGGFDHMTKLGTQGVQKRCLFLTWDQGKVIEGTVEFHDEQWIRAFPMGPGFSEDAMS